MASLSTAVTQARDDGLSTRWRWSRPDIDQWDPLVEFLTLNHWRKFARFANDGVSPQQRETASKAYPSSGYAQYKHDKQTGLLQREFRRFYDVLTHLVKKRVEREATLQDYYKEVAEVAGAEPVDLVGFSKIEIEQFARLRTVFEFEGTNESLCAWIRLRAVAEKNDAVQQAEQFTDLLTCDFKETVTVSGQSYMDVLGDWHGRVIEFTNDFSEGVSNSIVNAYVLPGAPVPARIFLKSHLAVWPDGLRTDWKTFYDSLRSLDKQVGGISYERKGMGSSSPEL